MAFLETGSTMSPWYNRDLNSGYISDKKINEYILYYIIRNLKSNFTIFKNNISNA